MTLLVVHPQPVEFEIESELELLFREARRRQRRRRLKLVLVGTLTVALLAIASAALTWSESRSPVRRDAAASAALTAARCPASPVRFVANSQFDAFVIGDGRVRLGVGNMYVKASHRFVVSHRGRHGWAGIEAIWWLAEPDFRGSLVVRGKAIGKQGPIEVKPSSTGLAPGSGPLKLATDFRSAPNASAYPAAYPGSLWVRSGGCYAVEIRGRGFSERLVFDIIARSV